MRYLALTLAALLAGCGAADAQYETPVDPNSVAGDFKGVTGTVIRLSDFKSSFVNNRDVEIWLPPSYSTEPEKHYPVLYMHDGQNVFDPSQSQYSGWDWGVDEALTELITEGKTPEVIVVAPHSLDATRNQDYFPEKAGRLNEAEFRAAFGEFDPDTLRGDEYLQFLTQELKPHIDENFRTKPEREHTSVMGSSMGALISLYAISEYPDVFGAAGMVSTHLPLADGALIDFYSANLPDPKTHRLYFDYGTETLDHNYEGYQTQLDAKLAEAGYRRGENWTTRKFEGDDHSERAWRNRVHVPLMFLLAGEAIEGGEER